VSSPSPPPSGIRRFLVDQNITNDLAGALIADGAYATHTALIGLDNAYDLGVFNYAREHGLAIITHDHDFAQDRQRFGPPHFGIVLVELPQRWSVEDMVRRIVSALHPLRSESIADRLVIIAPSSVTVRDQ
jgi:predicted nuclease of predicted toxin-antitoxin system